MQDTDRADASAPVAALSADEQALLESWRVRSIWNEIATIDAPPDFVRAFAVAWSGAGS
jgi:hypothetical protein